MSERVLLEAHAHTRETSPCSWLPGAELVRELKKKGYGAVVVTDHFVPGRFTNTETRQQFLNGWRAAKAEGEKQGIVVLPGMEIRFAQGNEDFLVYGMEESDFTDLPDTVCEDGLHVFHQLAQQKGWLVYQAHPYRPDLKTQDPRDLDGVETFNSQPRWDSKNRLAALFASKNHLRTIAGGDVHWKQDEGIVGISVPAEVLTPRGFAEWLRDTPSPAVIYQEAPIDGIRYTVDAAPNSEMLSALYRDAGWTAYLENPQRSLEGLYSSYRLITAWDDTALVGMARCISDGKTVMFIPDLLVHSSFRRRGIGKQLMAHLIADIPEGMQLMLAADDNPRIKAFLKECGFEELAEYHSAGFIRVNRI